MSSTATRPGVFTAWPEGMAAMRSLEAVVSGSGVSKRPLALVKLWCSILNGCAFCIAMHSAEAKRQGLSDEDIAALTGMHDMGALDESERTLMKAAGMLTGLSGPDAAEEAAAMIGRHFNRDDTVRLIFAIAIINTWNRLAMADGLTAEDFAARAAKQG